MKRADLRQWQMGPPSERLGLMRTSSGYFRQAGGRPARRSMDALGGVDGRLPRLRPPASRRDGEAGRKAGRTEDVLSFAAHGVASIRSAVRVEAAAARNMLAIRWFHRVCRSMEVRKTQMRAGSARRWAAGRSRRRSSGQRDLREIRSKNARRVEFGVKPERWRSPIGKTRRNFARPRRREVAKWWSSLTLKQRKAH